MGGGHGNSSFISTKSRHSLQRFKLSSSTWGRNLMEWQLPCLNKEWIWIFLWLHLHCNFLHNLAYGTMAIHLCYFLYFVFNPSF